VADCAGPGIPGCAEARQAEPGSRPAVRGTIHCGATGGGSERLQMPKLDLRFGGEKDAVVFRHGRSSRQGRRGKWNLGRCSRGAGADCSWRWAKVARQGKGTRSRRGAADVGELLRGGENPGAVRWLRTFKVASARPTTAAGEKVIHRRFGCWRGRAAFEFERTLGPGPLGVARIGIGFVDGGNTQTRRGVATSDAKLRQGPGMGRTMLPVAAGPHQDSIFLAQSVERDFRPKRGGLDEIHISLGSICTGDIRGGFIFALIRSRFCGWRAPPAIAGRHVGLPATGQAATVWALGWVLWLALTACHGFSGRRERQRCSGSWCFPKKQRARAPAHDESDRRAKPRARLGFCASARRSGRHNFASGHAGAATFGPHTRPRRRNQRRPGSRPASDARGWPFRNTSKGACSHRGRIDRAFCRSRFPEGENENP